MSEYKGQPRLKWSAIKRMYPEISELCFKLAKKEVSGEEINRRLSKYLEDNPNHTVPYGGTEGYWNGFLHVMSDIGLTVVVQQTEESEA